MSLEPEGFFVTGGTMGSDALSYIERAADTELRSALLAGRYCYVLTARQMGKSSLMVRTAASLREAGVRTVLLDLTAMGRNLLPEQWYFGLLSHLGQQLGLEQELRCYWQEHSEIGPLQRWMEALSSVVLPAAGAPLVLFLDEIDSVRSLPFSTAEFFASIRECFNRRTYDTLLRSLTFCLLGVATPADLIEDTRTTPFNIGERIELTDFTEAEAAPLAMGLQFSGPYSRARTSKEAETLLHRVLFWSGGHPYLTQKLCRAVAIEAAASRPKAVDVVCRDLFFTPAAQMRDDNLLFARDRLLRWEEGATTTSEARVRILDLYLRVWRSGVPQTSEPDPVESALRLSGVVTGRGGKLRVRNRIYSTVFDRAWVEQHLPGAELQRQRAAYRRGLIRAGSLAGFVAASLGGLSLIAFEQANLAQERYSKERLNLYVAAMSLSQRAMEEGNINRSQVLLDRLRPRAGDTDLRDLEWYLLKGFGRGKGLPWEVSVNSTPLVLRFSPDSSRLTAAARLGDVISWDPQSGMRERIFQLDPGPSARALSVDCKRLVTSSLTAATQESRVHLWDIASKTRVRWTTFRGRDIRELEISDDGKWIAIVTGNLGHLNGPESVLLWDAASGAVSPLGSFTSGVTCLRFSAAGQSLLIGHLDGTISAWATAQRKRLRSWRFPVGPADALAISPDGARFVAGGRSSTPYVFNSDVKSSPIELTGARGVGALALSSGGDEVAGGGLTGEITVWSLREAGARKVLGVTNAPVLSLAYSPDGETLASGAVGTVTLWHRQRKPPVSIVKAFSSSGALLARSPRNEWVAVSDLGEWSAYDSEMRRVYHSMSAFKHRPLALSSDGTRSAFESSSGAFVLRRGAEQMVQLSGLREVPVAAVFSLDGSLIWAGSRAGTIASFRTDTGLETQRRPVEPEMARLSVSPSGELLACSYPDKDLVIVLDARTLHETKRYRVRRAFSLCFTADSQALAVGSEGSVRLVPLRGSVTNVGEGLMGLIQTIQFSPSGRTVVAGASGGAKLSNCRSGEEVLSLPTPWTTVRAVACSEYELAILTDEGVLQRWGTGPGSGQN